MCRVLTRSGGRPRSDDPFCDVCLWLLYFCLTLLLTALGIAVILAGGIIFGVSKLFAVNRPEGYENAGMMLGRGMWHGTIAAVDRMNHKGQFKRR